MERPAEERASRVILKNRRHRTDQPCAAPAASHPGIAVATELRRCAHRDREVALCTAPSEVGGLIGCTELGVDFDPPWARLDT